MNRTLLLLVTGAMWAFMISELVKREVLPYYEYQAPPSYRTLIQGQRDPRLQRWSIWLGTDRIGEAESLFDPGEVESRVRTRTSYDAAKTLPSGLRRALGGGPLLAEMWSDLRIDSTYQISDLALHVRSLAKTGHARGRREGDKLVMAYELKPFLKGERTVDFPRDTTLSDVSLPLIGAGRLKVNKKWQFSTVDLDIQDGLKVTSLFALVEAKETYLRGSERIAAYRIDVKKKPTDATNVYQILVDEKGQVLEQRRREGDLELRMVCEEARAPSPDAIRAWRWDPPERP